MQILNCSRILRSGIAGCKFPGVVGVSYGNIAIERLGLLSCNCQHAESITAEDGNGSWFVDNAKNFNAIQSMVNPPNLLEFEDVHKVKQEKEGSASNGRSPAVGTVRDTLQMASVDSIEDEAWELLRESMVYYCGSPIGTIAAKDPTSSIVLNYDQVFIRDFIPSGIAFLLKGEYDIVRNFILHTLQLQVTIIVHV